MDQNAIHLLLTISLILKKIVTTLKKLMYEMFFSVKPIIVYINYGYYYLKNMLSLERVYHARLLILPLKCRHVYEQNSTSATKHNNDLVVIVSLISCMFNNDIYISCHMIKVTWSSIKILQLLFNFRSHRILHMRHQPLKGKSINTKNGFEERKSWVLNNLF